MTSLVGKTAVVTGGCSGIGYAVVKTFLEQGIKNIAILDICDTKNISQSLQSTYESKKVVFIQTDVSKKDQVKSAFDEVIKVFGYIDIVIGNAGVFNERDYERMVNVNLLGVLHSTYTAIELMSKDKGGHGGTVINVASLAGLEVYSNLPAYSATKHGIVGWQRCFSDEYYYQKHGIKFMTICPGPTDTPIITDFDNKANFGTLESSNFQFQPQTAVAQCILNVLNLAKNGSIWIIDNNKMKEVISFNVETSQEVLIKND